MKKKVILSLSAALVAALCIPAIAFGVGGARPSEIEQREISAQALQGTADVVGESVSLQLADAENAVPEDSPAAIDVMEAESPVAAPARGRNYVDENGDGVCDNYGTSNCAGTGNGVCDGTGNGFGNGNGVCDGTGASGNGGYGNRGANGQGAADRSCDGTGRGSAPGGHFGNGYQRR